MRDCTSWESTKDYLFGGSSTQHIAKEMAHGFVKSQQTLRLLREAQGEGRGAGLHPKPAVVGYHRRGFAI
jgi:hypothetical protein